MSVLVVDTGNSRTRVALWRDATTDGAAAVWAARTGGAVDCNDPFIPPIRQFQDLP